MYLFSKYLYLEIFSGNTNSALIFSSKVHYMAGTLLRLIDILLFIIVWTKEQINHGNAIGQSTTCGVTLLSTRNFGQGLTIHTITRHCCMMESFFYLVKYIQLFHCNYFTFCKFHAKFLGFENWNFLIHIFQEHVLVRYGTKRMLANANTF